MFFKGILFDPYSLSHEEFTNYPKFIEEIRRLGLLKIQESSPVEEEERV